jgi:hypothetical protein
MERVNNCPFSAKGKKDEIIAIKEILKENFIPFM